MSHLFQWQGIQRDDKPHYGWFPVPTLEQQYGKQKHEENMSKRGELYRCMTLLIQLRWRRGIVFTCIRVSSRKYLPKE